MVKPGGDVEGGALREGTSFDFGDANKGQRQAISTVDGPVLITAGPGTGKTYTLVQRAIYLIEERGLKPENIFIVTFTEKAAKELVTRLTNELAARNIPVNINDMYVGTFHSLCLRILKEHLEFTRLRKNFRLIDAFDQQYMVCQNIRRFRDLPGFDGLFRKMQGAWRQAGTICGYANGLAEEMVDPAELEDDEDPHVAAIGRIVEEYRSLLAEQNLMDFSSIQSEAYRLLTDHPDVLAELRGQITHVMVDEYQDTNFIQERLVFLLAGQSKSICVVGDDDQGLYRFRGATIRNILEFPSHFPEGVCRVIPLTVNYRSDSGIIDFYNRWMETTSGSKFKFDWGRYRYPKRIVPCRQSTVTTPTVVTITGQDDEDDWHERILAFITSLKESGTLTDYNQIAFLFNSVKHQRVTDLASYLEAHGISVYSPRSDMFFQRDEIRLALGCLMLLFPRYVADLEHGMYEHLKPENTHYYVECIQFANEQLKKSEHADLRKWIRSTGIKHASLKGTTDYAYSGLLYQMLRFQPFARILDTDIDSGLADTRPVRNLARLTQIIGKFEYLHHIDVLNDRPFRNQNRPGIDVNTEFLFNWYLRLLLDEGIAEYEDDSEYAPSGCVSFLTIHQAKGMEFPVVIVDSLHDVPKKNSNGFMEAVEARYLKRPAFEPSDQVKYFDFWRRYYTAFSRAQDLLVLTCNRNNRAPSKYFKDAYDQLPDISRLDPAVFTLHAVKAVNIKNTYSFTSNIATYETCARQYKFYKELGFLPVRTNAMLFGTLVHETIEDIHKAVLRGEENTITVDNIRRWFDANYATLTQTEHSYLARAQQEAAYQQVLRYVDRQHGDWRSIQQAEVEVSLVRPEYIIDGKIDLVRGKDDTVEIVDFKTGRKPDMDKDSDLLERYRRQLNVYAYLVEQRTGLKVSRMHLYFTAEDDAGPYITYPYQKIAIQGTMESFDDTVHKIMAKDFRHTANNTEICKDCDLKYYCMNK